MNGPQIRNLALLSAAVVVFAWCCYVSLSWLLQPVSEDARSYDGLLVSGPLNQRVRSPPCPVSDPLHQRRTAFWKQCGNDLHNAIRTNEREEHPARTCSLQELSSAMRTGAGEVRSANSTFAINTCAVRWFDAWEVCDMFESRDIVLITVGDSLVRHLTNGLYVCATGSAVHGSVMWWHWNMSQVERQSCVCTTAFQDKSVFRCRSFNIAYAYASLTGDYRLVCPNWTRWRIIYLEIPIEPPGQYYDNVVQAVLRTRTAHATTIAFMAQGGHYNMNISKAAVSFSNFANVSAKYAVRTIFGTIHSSDDARKPLGQHMHRTLPLNEAVRSMATEMGAAMFETQSFTLNATSFDGTHYDQHINVPLAQVLLNYVDALSQ